MNKVSPLSALHAMGLNLHTIAANTIYKGKKGVPYNIAKSWFDKPAKEVKPQIQAMFQSACEILRKEGSIK